MKRILLCVLSFGVFCCPGRASEDEIILTIGDGVNWKSVFDAGFQPHHIREGRFACRQFDVNFGIRLRPDSQVLHMGRGDMEFELLDEHVLVLMTFYGRENRTVEESKRKSKVFAQIFGEHLTKKSVVRRFEATGRVDHSDAVNHAKIGNFSIFYSSPKSFNRDKPMLERFSVSLKSSVAKRGKRLDLKIQPPEGYEHISLAPVRNEPIVADDQKEEEIVEDRKAPQADTPSDEAEAPERQGLSWWIWLIAAAALGGIAWVMLRARLRSGT